MTNTPHDLPQNTPPSDVDVAGLIQSLRRKEGSWVEWGRACQALQKASYTPQAIFEETGFEPIQQNQIIVAAQVYTSILSAGVPEAVKAHFERKGSDVLYELRILTQAERAAVAELVLEKNLDMDEARDVAKAVKDFSRLGSVPEGFTTHPGDAIAYQTRKLVRQKADLQERSRLIARGLRFAHSSTARKQIEQLLTDFTVTPAKQAPNLPLYRLESEEELPRLLPVVGRLPLTQADLKAVPVVEEIAPFNMVHFSGTGAWIPVPGWRVILSAEDPVVILSDTNALPQPLSGKTEEIMIVVDRAQRQWNEYSYFVVAPAEELQIQWSEQQPDAPILGQVILIMRAKKILDEAYTKELWQIDE